jgi:tetratricopeptide (TPR) repeat protein
MGCMKASSSSVIILWFAVIFTAILFFGCAGSGKTDRPADRKASLTEEQQAELRHRATQHFIDGSLHEMQGEHEKAIGSYNEALKYDDNAAIYYALSKNYLELGRISLAAESGREAQKREPDNISYRENLARVYITAHEIDKAITEYEEIVRIDSMNVNNYYSLARLYQFKRPLKALDVYHKILNRWGDQIEILAQAADIYNTLGKYSEASDMIQRMLDIDPSNEVLMITLGNTFLRAERYEEAREIFTELYDIHPDDLEILTSLVDVYVSMKDYQTAAKYLNDVIQNDDLTLELKVQIGQVYLSNIEGDSSAAALAESIFDEIITQYPDAYEGYWFRGVTGLLVQDFDAAIRNLRRVNELNPENRDAWLYAVELLFQEGKYDELIGYADTALFHFADDADILFLLGMAYNRLERLDDAIQTLSKSVRANPEHTGAMSMLALSYDTADEHEKSDSIYLHILSIEPDNHLVLNNFSYSLAERGEKLEEALEMSKKAVDMEPENTAYLDTLGWIYFKLGDFENARIHIRKAIDIGSESSVVHDHMGDIYYYLKDRESAMEFWKKSLELDDTNERVREKIERGSAI